MHSSRPWIAFAFAAPLFVSALSGIGYGAEARTVFPTSIRTVPQNQAVAGAAVAVTPADLAEQMDFSVALQMRNRAELQARINQGEIIGIPEMTRKYFPLRSDYDKVAAWLAAQGFAVKPADGSPLSVFASGTVTQVQQAFQISFAKVQADGRSYSSAVTAPSIPTALAPVVLSINGLQPDVHPHKNSIIMPPQPHPMIGNQPPYLPSEIATAYGGGTAVTQTGNGQKIAIIIDTFPNKADLTAFWTAAGINQTLANIEFIQIVGGTLPPASGEETLDVEWSSGLAPQAKVRIYASRDLGFASLDQVFQALINDIPAQTAMHQVSISLGLGEAQVGAGQIQTDGNYFAAMTAAGLTVCASSGDSGSNEGGQLQVSYFASDPNVAGIGGTSLTLNSGTGAVTNEKAWTGSGGGISSAVARPTWQLGTGVVAGTQRLVPDVSSVGDPNTGALIVLDGQTQQIGGTSWSSPSWGAYCALINQARGTSALGPLGLLGPKVYPLLGTANFRDITTGSNGAYPATTGYDRSTGLGVPNLKALIQTLGGNLPNLTPGQPAGWTDKIVISNKTGTNTDSVPLSFMDSLFADFSVLNNGGIATSSSTPFTVTLSVDGATPVSTVTSTAALAPNAFFNTLDVPLGQLTRGFHTVTVSIDTTNVIGENDETDNQYTKTIFIIGLPPVVTTTTGNASYTENQSAVAVDPGITVTDSDSTVLVGGTVSFTANFQPAEDSLFYSPADGITGTYDPVAGVLTLIGNASPSAYQAAARRVKYINFSDNPSSALRTVTFAISDGGSSGTATRKVAVVPVNDAPAATSVNVLTNEDTPKTFTLTGTDAENSALTFTVTSQPQNGHLTGTAPNVTYTPNPNYNGPDSFTFKVNDGQLDSLADATVTITVFPVNDAPFATAQNVNTNEDTALPITLTGTDIENSPLTFTVATQPQHGTLSGTAPNLTYQPATGYSGPDSFTFTSNDGDLDSVTPGTINIAVNPVNHAPTFVAGPNQVVINVTSLQTVPNWATAITDGPEDNGQIVSFILQSDQPALFVVQPAVDANGTLTFQAAPTAAGITTVTIMAHDNGGTAFGGSDTSAPQSFHILITPPNFPPTFTAGPNVAVPEGSSAYAQPWATDISPGAPHESAQVLNFILQVDHPELFSVAPAISPTGVLTFTPAASASGLATVTVTLHDDGGTANNGRDTSDPQTFDIAVTTFSEEVGTYNGLIVPAGPDAPDESRFGVARVTIAPTGALTAKVEVGGRSYALKGRVDLSGNVVFGKSATPTATLTRPNLDSFELSLLLDVSRGTDKLAGTITLGGANPALVATLDADRALYTAKKNPTAPFMNPPAGLPGKYTAIFGAQTPAAQGLSPDLYPQGDGVAFITVGADGSVRVTGSLADGSKVSTANALSKVNSLPFHMLTDNRKGSITGPILFRNTPNVSDLDAADITWIKPINVKATSYPSGWQNGIGIDIVGSAYAPVAGQPALPGLGAPGANGNAGIDLSIGGLPIGGLPKTANIDTSSRVSIITQPSTDKLALSINAKTGAIAGSFVFPVSGHRTQIHGVILQKSQRGAGYFVSALASGHFSLTPAP